MHLNAFREKFLHHVREVDWTHEWIKMLWADAEVNEILLSQFAWLFVHPDFLF
jgi:hypothetical protein